MGMKIIEYARHKARLLRRRVRNAVFVPKTDFERELVEAGFSFESWLKRRRSAPRQYVELGAAHARHLAAVQPDRAAATVTDAEQVLRHQFDLLGSGPFTPVDPARPVRPDGYVPIDWYVDPVRRLRFPTGVPHREWKLYEMRPANADVKYPWELARCQHWPTLGQAWRLTSDPRFAVEIANELDDFVEANPVGIGINWTCTMDVALRAANWCLGLALVLDCPSLDRDFWRRAYRAVFDHGRFIYENLENVYEVTSNHFLSNVIGLHFIAAEFPELAQGRAWQAFCLKSLETEINIQVLPDGADFESAVPYHRLVTELFMGSARLAELQGTPLSAHYRERLAAMVDYVVGVMRPDGLMPVIGDADDGRLHVFTDYVRWNRQDARHLLAPAAMLLKRPDWLRHAGDAGRWEATWWGFDPGEIRCEDQPPSDHTRLFPEAGVAIARCGGNYLAVTNAIVGTKGFGNHKHNEQLGFEYHAHGVPVLVDPGSYVYTSDFAARNLFRSTAYHNTVMVDGQEQNETNPEWIFRLIEKAEPEHLAFEETGHTVVYRGRHKGYGRFDGAVLHERSFTFFKATGVLLIHDVLDGAGEHDLLWHFHAAPGVEAIAERPGSYALTAGGRSFRLAVAPDLAGEVVDAWYSPSYGVRVAVKAIDLRCRHAFEGRSEWRTVIGPCEHLDDTMLQHLLQGEDRMATLSSPAAL
jgi:hypothetical protein